MLNIQIFREMQIKTTMRCYLTQVRMAIINKSTKNKCWRGYREKEPFYTIGGNVNWYNHYEKQYGGSSENWIYDLSILLLEKYLDKTTISKDTCPCMFIAALFTIVRHGKKHKCPLTEEWIKNMCYVYTKEYYSALKRMT